MNKNLAAINRMAQRGLIAERALHRGNVRMAEAALRPYVKNNAPNISKINYRPAKAANIEENSFSNNENNNNNNTTETVSVVNTARTQSNASSELSVAAVNENYSGFTPNLVAYMKSKGITPKEIRNNMAKARARANARKASAAATKKRGFAGQFWNALIIHVFV